MREQQQEIKAKSGAVIHRIPLTAISLDPGLYPPSQRRQPTIRKQLELLRQGQKVSPVKVVKDQSAAAHGGKRYLLVDGYATWKALQRRTRLCRNGKWGANLPQIELDMILVELVDAPVHRERSRDLQDRIRSLYRNFPGYPEGRAAKELGCDVKTIKKYAAIYLGPWENEVKKLIEQMSAEGRSSREIAQALQLKWPHARGLSQSAMSRKIRKSPTC